jgi:Fe2+ transport system protein FeoA
VLGETAETARLKALGVCEGRVIEILRTGDAWVLRVLGSRIGISRELAASVLLTAA